MSNKKLLNNPKKHIENYIRIIESSKILENLFIKQALSTRNKKLKKLKILCDKIKEDEEESFIYLIKDIQL